ncbi:unnamed protein product [Cylicostephanus goldi]|uniref:Uncharacterized protein n=1 Tax=Cylicostephanus goldi TaxID=71465 RepID=A0A3P6TDW9_CYLGO|nr:unnamed protein product [Cylicostephanus goldi]
MTVIGLGILTFPTPTPAGKTCFKFAIAEEVSNAWSKMLFFLLLINVCAAAESGSTAPSVELTSVDYSALTTTDNVGLVVGQFNFSVYFD